MPSCLVIEISPTTADLNQKRHTGCWLLAGSSRAILQIYSSTLPEFIEDGQAVLPCSGPCRGKRHIALRTSKVLRPNLDGRILGLSLARKRSCPAKVSSPPGLSAIIPHSPACIHAVSIFCVLPCSGRFLKKYSLEALGRDSTSYLLQYQAVLSEKCL